MNRWLNLLADSVAQGIGWTTGIVAAIWVLTAIGAWPAL
jgi:hypothetical protein